jgi:hypothetical protein
MHSSKLARLADAATVPTTYAGPKASDPLARQRISAAQCPNRPVDAVGKPATHRAWPGPTTPRLRHRLMRSSCRDKRGRADLPQRAR